MHNAYPTAQELVDYFALNQYPVISIPVASSLIDSAVATWERLVCHSPFLASLATKDFDVVLSQSNDGYRLNLESHPIMKNVAIVHENASGVLRTLLAGSDFDLLPLNAGVHLNPHFIVRFRSNLGSGKVRIEGQFGWATSVPQDVYDAVINLAVAMHLSRLSVTASFASGGREAEKLKQGPVEITYSSESHHSVSNAEMAMGSVARGYRC